MHLLTRIVHNQKITKRVYSPIRPLAQKQGITQHILLTLKSSILIDIGFLTFSYSEPDIFSYTHLEEGRQNHSVAVPLCPHSRNVIPSYGELEITDRIKDMYPENMPSQGGI